VGLQPLAGCDSEPRRQLEVCLLCVLCVVRYRYLLRANHSPECDVSECLDEEEALAHYWLLRNEETNLL